MIFFWFSKYNNRNMKVEQMSNTKNNNTPRTDNFSFLQQSFGDQNYCKYRRSLIIVTTRSKKELPTNIRSVSIYQIHNRPIWHQPKYSKLGTVYHRQRARPLSTLIMPFIKPIILNLLLREKTKLLHILLYLLFWSSGA